MLAKFSPPLFILWINIFKARHLGPRYRQLSFMCWVVHQLEFRTSKFLALNDAMYILQGSYSTLNTWDTMCVPRCVDQSTKSRQTVLCEVLVSTSSGWCTTNHYLSLSDVIDQHIQRSMLHHSLCWWCSTVSVKSIGKSIIGDVQLKSSWLAWDTKSNNQQEGYSDAKDTFVKD
jgi:hypothetical protein